MSNNAASKNASAPQAACAKGTAFKRIPLVNIAALYGSDERAKASVAAQMAKAASEVGFLYVKGHAIPPEKLTRLRDRAAEFFALPQEVKMKYYIGLSRAHRGYVPTGEENFYDGDALLKNEKPKVDKKEAFDLSVELAEDDPDHVAGYRMLGPNQWPDEIEDFKKDIYDYYQAAMSLGHTLFRGFALALGLPEDHFEASLKRPPSQLRLVHYPQDDKSIARQDVQWGISAHTDYECFTILHATSPGLEVLNAEGRWIDAPPLQDAFVINVGDMLEALSNGRFIATPHRVRNVPEERFSFPLFCALDYDTLIEPLPQCVAAGEKPLYPSYVAGDHLVTMTMRTFSYLRDLVSSGSLSLRETEEQATVFGRKEETSSTTRPDEENSL